MQKAEAIAKTKGGIIIPEKAQSKVSIYWSDNGQVKRIVEQLL